MPESVPAIWTSMYAEQPAAQALETLAGQGWSVFEFSGEHFVELETAPDREARLERVLAVCRDRGLRIPQGHALLKVRLCHPQPECRAGDIQRLKVHISLAQRLGIAVLVVHPGMAEDLTTREQRRRNRDLNVAAYRELGAFAARHGCRLALENMAREGFRTSADLLELVAAIDRESVGIAFDSSHAHMAPAIDLPAAIADFGDKLWATHLSDNDGRGDQHLVPGHGTIDWQALMDALNANRYRGLVNLELPGERHPDPVLRALKSRHARAVGGWLMEQMGKGQA